MEILIENCLIGSFAATCALAMTLACWVYCAVKWEWWFVIPSIFFILWIGIYLGCKEEKANKVEVPVEVSRSVEH